VETLDTYSHIWPDSEDKTRSAIEAAFKETGFGLTEDFLRTESPA
jgi:hypothetical protein